MIDGIYTAYLTGIAGQAMAMFVFKDGKIGGSDMVGIVFSGEYAIDGDDISGILRYSMPANSASITGATFETASDEFTVPLNLPVDINPDETYPVNTPTGALNAKFVKNVDL
jgi:hypothetical protein